MNLIKKLVVLSVIALSAFTSPSLQSKEIYHPNGAIAWNYDVFSPFYHDNAKIAWNGLKHPKTRNFFYDDSSIAWKGYTYSESSRASTVYHRNGNKMWEGASSKDLYFSYEPCTIYHSNKQLAWKGALYKEPYFSVIPCTLFHNNGTTAWKGASSKDLYFTDEPCTIYHSNGKVAWRGSFGYKNSNRYSSGLYYDNGQLAWNGKQNAPFYDENGEIVVAEIDALNLPLGEDSWLYVSCQGETVFNLCLGDNSYLQFTNQNDNPALVVNLGQGFNLRFFPHSGNQPKFSCYDIDFKLNYRK